MSSSDELLNGIRENDLASAMIELTRSIRSLRSDTAASQAAGVRFDAKLLTSIAKLADIAGGLKSAKSRIESAEAAAAAATARVEDATGRFGQLERAIAAISDDFKKSNEGYDGLVKARVGIAYEALGKRISDISTQINALPRGGFKGDPGKPGTPGPGLPKGGSEGQIPVKASDNDYDIVWRAPDNANGGERAAFTIWNAPASSGGSAANGLPVGGTAGQVLSKIDGTDYNVQWVAVGGTGTVTTVSVATANGISGSVANATTTPAITLTLGAITPTTIVASGAVSGSNLSGTNTGDQTITLTGDVTGTGAGSFAASVAKIQGVTVTGTTGTVNVVFSNSPTLVTPALGTPASGVLTNCTGLPVAGGGTGQATLTIHGVLIGNTTSGINVTAAGTSGQLLTSQGAADPQYKDNFATLTFVIDGGGVAITTGVKGDLEIPFACTINRVTTLADQSGSIVVDIWKDSYANYPPTVADTITASAKPTLSTATKAQDATLTGWTTAIAAGDTLRFNVDSITTCQRVTISLKVTKS